MKDFSREEQIKKWQEAYGEDVSASEYASICSNLEGFFTVLKRWDKKKKDKKST